MAGGYGLERFIHPVDEDFRCSICNDVLRDVRLCEAGKHHFCFYCITQYLDKKSRTCKWCQQPLTPATLKRPQRFLRDRLSELIIKCVYFDEGCPKQVELKNLEKHENDCRYRLIPCGRCGLEFRAREMNIHQNPCEANFQPLQMQLEQFRASSNSFQESMINQVGGIHQRVTILEEYLMH